MNVRSEIARPLQRRIQARTIMADVARTLAKSRLVALPDTRNAGSATPTA